MPKYENVSVVLVNEDGNAFSIMGRVTKALRRAKVSDTAVKTFQQEAMAGDYDNLLQTVMKWVNVE